MTTRTVTTTDAGSDVHTGLETADETTETTGVSTHARVIAENNECKWCGGPLSGRVESTDGVAEVTVDCDDCGRDYV
ncbi:MAG: hypothetical protein ABEI99_07515 [Halobaculum sp.]